MKRMLLALTTLAILMAPGAVRAQAGWVHVRADGDDEETVRMNLPVRMVAVALEAIRDDLQDGDVLGDAPAGFTFDDLREMWQSVRDAGDVELVNIQDGDEQVRVYRQDDRIHIEASDGDAETVRIEMPVEIADALLRQDGDAADLQTVIGELVRRGEPDLVQITGPDGTVRVWVDNRAEQEG